jgi:hypothetical protein
MFRQIMVPVDGLALAEGALVHADRLARLAMQRAERSGATIHMVRVVAPVFIPAPWGTDVYGAIAQDSEAEMLRAAEYLDGLARRPELAHLSSRYRVERGDPAERIVELGRDRFGRADETSALDAIPWSIGIDLRARAPQRRCAVAHRAARYPNRE